MRICYCDRCGAEMTADSYENTGYISIVWRQFFDGDIVTDNPLEDADFCEDCMNQIKEFIVAPARERAAREAAEEEAPPVPADVEQPEETDKPEPARHPYSAQKLREMVKDGKSAKEIADYFGFSLATYYKKRKHAEML